MWFRQGPCVVSVVCLSSASFGGLSECEFEFVCGYFAWEAEPFVVNSFVYQGVCGG